MAVLGLFGRFRAFLEELGKSTKMAKITPKVEINENHVFETLPNLDPDPKSVKISPQNVRLLEIARVSVNLHLLSCLFAF